MIITIALIQAKHPGDMARAFEKATAMCATAASMGADIALFPEMWSNGYTFFDPSSKVDLERWTNSALRDDDALLLEVGDLAQELNLSIAMTYLRRTDGKPENSVVLYDRFGDAVLRYSKVHLCWYGLESSCGPGTEFQVVDLDTIGGVLRVGAMICFDREIPESARVLGLKGAELVLVPNACTLEEHRFAQFKTRAFENKMALAMTNYPAPRYNGHSIAVDGVFFDARGQSLDPISVTMGETEDIALAKIDIQRLREYRAQAIWDPIFRCPDTYEAIASRQLAPALQGFNAKINGNLRDPQIVKPISVEEHMRKESRHASRF